MSTLKVLDCGTLLAGPVTATILGDLGADVIKVEQPGSGDPLRAIGSGTAGMSDLWLIEARNKRSVTLNLRQPRGQELLRRLADWADVLVENFRPGTMASWGLGYEDLRQSHHHLVYVSVSGYGQTGPYRHRAGIDRAATAYGGMTYVTGHPDGDPVRPGYAVADYLGAVFGAIGALEAVRRRDAAGPSGHGDWVDVGLHEPLMRIAEFSIPHHARDGIVRERYGNRSPSSTPSDVYRTRDGHWITTTAPSDSLFRRLAELMDRRDLLARPDLIDNRGRVEHADELEDAVRQWVSAIDRGPALAQLHEAGIPASGINSVADIAADAHMAARGNLVQVAVPKHGTITMQGVVPRLVTEPGAVRWAGPPLGASTADVLSELAGVDEAELAALVQEGIV